MLLLLIRHAQAAEQNEKRYPDDTLRPLMPKGRSVQQRICKEMGKRKLVPDRVFSSPWKRAWQTARIVVEEAGLPKKARIACQSLAGLPDLAALAADIGEVKPDETIALVGHKPWIDALAALLLTGSASGLTIDFTPSAVMAIETAELTPATGTLKFFLHR